MFQNTKLKDRLGRCYEFAFKFVRDNQQFTLVHGIGYSSQTKEIIGHAWCEIDDIAYDAVMDEAIQKEDYYKGFKLEDTFKYTAQEAIELVNEYEHYGYWDSGMNRAYPNGVKILFEKKNT